MECQVKCCERVLMGCLQEHLTSLSQAIKVPSGLKTAIINPVLKKQNLSYLNNYRPVAPTSITMKCFEKLVLYHIKTNLPPSFDSHQFAYRAKRYTEDAFALERKREKGGENCRKIIGCQLPSLEAVSAHILAGHKALPETALTLAIGQVVQISQNTHKQIQS